MPHSAQFVMLPGGFLSSYLPLAGAARLVPPTEKLGPASAAAAAASFCFLSWAGVSLAPPRLRPLPATEGAAEVDAEAEAEAEVEARGASESLSGVPVSEPGCGVGALDGLGSSGMRA